MAPLPIQYSDYAAWQREHLDGQVLEDLKEYWRAQLAGAPSRIQLPTDRPHPPFQDFRGARYAVTLPCPVRESVEEFSRQNACAPYRILCAAFNVLLACYTGKDDFCVGTPVSVPLPPEVEPLIGFFAHTVIIRTRVPAEGTFRGLTKQVSSTVSAVKRAALPFDLIVEAVQPPRDASRMVLFQVNFRVVKAPLPPLALPGLEVTLPEWVDTDTSKFDLAMELVENGDPGGFIEYRTDLFDEPTIARLADDYFGLVAGLIAEPDRPISDVGAVQNVWRRFRRFKPLTPRVTHRARGVEIDPSPTKPRLEPAPYGAI
jgi:non-ribosomal peptide synthetase component F